MDELVKRIVSEQSQIIGESLARQMAINTGTVRFNSKKIDDITVTGGDPGRTIEKLIEAYQNLFGQASVEVCMDVLKTFPESEIGPFLTEELRNNLSKGDKTKYATTG